MHTMFRKFITVLPIILLPLKEYAQSVQRYQNCLYAEYGVVQYNNIGHEWLGASGNILSAGLGYNREIFSFLALGLKAKYYEQAIQAGTRTWGSNTMQFQFRLQRSRISRTFRLRRLIPYIETGIGHASEFNGNDRQQISAEYLYVPLLAGMDYQFGNHWSLGVQGEYRLSGKDFATVSDDLGKALNPFNTAAVRLGFYFGAKRKIPSVPKIYTRPVPANFHRVNSQALQADSVSARPSSAAPTAQAEKLPAGTMKITDTVLVRMIGAGQVPLQTAIVHAPSPQLNTAGTVSKADTAMAGKRAVQDSLILSRQDAIVSNDTAAVIVKAVAPLPENNALPPVQEAMPGKSDSLLSADTGSCQSIQRHACPVTDRILHGEGYRIPSSCTNGTL